MVGQMLGRSLGRLDWPGPKLGLRLDLKSGNHIEIIDTSANPGPRGSTGSQCEIFF